MTLQDYSLFFIVLLVVVVVVVVLASGVKTAPAFLGFLRMLTFVRTCNTSACYVTSWVGWGGDVDVRENLQHIRMLRNLLGGVGWGC